MAQQHTTKPGVVEWEPGEYGIVEKIKYGWHGYVGSRDDAYAELERIEKVGRTKWQTVASNGEGG